MNMIPTESISVHSASPHIHGHFGYFQSLITLNYVVLSNHMHVLFIFIQMNLYSRFLEVGLAR